MAKSTFFCQHCGYQAPKWMGQCPSCKKWNVFVEEQISKKKLVDENIIPKNDTQISLLSTFEGKEKERIKFQNDSLNRVLGGGLVSGSLVLLSGEPGIGKSTLVLQALLGLRDTKTLYISGEESKHQIKLRAERLNIKNNKHCFIGTDTLIDNLLSSIKEVAPDVIVIDSIQTLETTLIDSPPGSVSQIRECMGVLIKLSKISNIPIIIIGHINKEGLIAGPKVLEHMVDVVLQFEGDKRNFFRILRCLKNRFGSTREIGIYEMTHRGILSVENPSNILTSQRDQMTSGVTVSASMEGYQPFLIETQALVSRSPYSTPQRSPTGYDSKRLHMLLAVLEKKSDIQLYNQDVFVNVIGGLKIEDTGLDLGVLVSILSSFYNVAIFDNICFAGEVGLSGEIRKVSGMESRIQEADRMGFKEIYISSYGKSVVLSKKLKIKIISVTKVSEIASLLFS